MYISSGIAHDSTNPTVFQSIAYFLSLADGTSFESPPSTPRRTSSRNSNSAPKSYDAANSSPKSSRPSSSKSSPSMSRKILASKYSAAENHFALEDFDIKSVLGTGRTKVYYEQKNQLALKAIDLWKHSNMLSELHHEKEINISTSL